MTVAELVKRLRKYPDDALVCIPDYTGFDYAPDGEYTIDTVEEQLDRSGRLKRVILS